MSLVKSLTKWSAPSSEVNSGKSDLLLRYFQTSAFDAWVALQYLYQNTQPGVHDYLCNRLHELGEEALEKFLLQFVYLAVSKPGQALERTIVDLCSKSFRIAIKTQWLLVALCQDHPKNKALESFRERAYKAALEGKWEVPIRNPKLDPLSPYTSQLLSPPLSPPFSPTSSLMLSHFSHQLAPRLHDNLPLLPKQSSEANHPDVLYTNQTRIPDRSVATQPPGRMVMSPPNAGLAAGAKTSAPQRPSSTEESTPLTGRRSGGLQIDLGCLLPQDQATAASGGSAAAPAVSSEAAAATAHLANGHVTSTAATGASVTPGDGSLAITASPRPTAAPMPDPNANTMVDTHSRPTGTSPMYGVVSAAEINLAERMQSIRKELGEGEGVSALLERSKQGGGYVATEEEALFVDDEFSGRPMSPLSRLRYDTFGSTLDFVEALCDTSSVLTSYSQDERHRALRLGLEHVNREIEVTNRRDVAIWFPMGRGGDRVLRLTAREAVLLNSREKAPFLLYVEVLVEGQQEGGKQEQQQPQGAGAADVPGAASVNAAALGQPSEGRTPSVPVVEFGRRETYGIALTGIGAQHQQQYGLHLTQPGSSTASSSKGTVSPAPGAEAGKAAAGTCSGASGGKIATRVGALLDMQDHGSVAGSTTSGRISAPSQGANTADNTSTVPDTPGGLSPAMSISSQFRSSTTSPTGHSQKGSLWSAPQVAASGLSHIVAPGPQQSSYGHAPASPRPIHAASASHAAILEERAAAVAAEREAAASASAKSSPQADDTQGLTVTDPAAVGHPSASSPIRDRSGADTASFALTRQAFRELVMAVEKAGSTGGAVAWVPPPYHHLPRCRLLASPAPWNFVGSGADGLLPAFQELVAGEALEELRSSGPSVGDVREMLKLLYVRSNGAGGGGPGVDAYVDDVMEMVGGAVDAARLEWRLVKWTPCYRRLAADALQQAKSTPPSAMNPTTEDALLADVKHALGAVWAALQRSTGRQHCAEVQVALMRVHEAVSGATASVLKSSSASKDGVHELLVAQEVLAWLDQAAGEVLAPQLVPLVPLTYGECCTHVMRLVHTAYSLARQAAIISLEGELTKCADAKGRCHGAAPVLVSAPLSHSAFATASIAVVTEAPGGVKEASPPNGEQQLLERVRPPSGSQTPLPAAAVVIPTRSTSNTNIAAAALAATIAATCGSGAGTPSARSSDSGAVLPLSASGGQPGTPRMSGLGGAAPASAVAAVAVAASQPLSSGLPPRPPLPAGSCSPVNAANEVSYNSAPTQATSSSSVLGATSLLRRVLGERAEEAAAAAAASATGPQLAGAGVEITAPSAGSAKVVKEGTIGSVVRSLCFSNPDSTTNGPSYTRPDVIASAVVAVPTAMTPPPGALPPRPHSAGLLPCNIAAPRQAQHSTKSNTQPGILAGAVNSANGPMGAGISNGATWRPPMPSRLQGAELSEEEMQELLSSGCLSPPPVVKSDPDMNSRLCSLMASLRGEAPMVRVRIRVLPQPRQTSMAAAYGHAHTNTYAAAASSNRGSDGGSTAAPTGSQTHTNAAFASRHMEQHGSGRTGGAAAGTAPMTGAASGTGRQGAPVAALMAQERGGGHGPMGPQQVPRGASSDGSDEREPMTFSLASLTARAKAALAADDTSASSAAGSDTTQGEKRQKMALLSRFGLCRKPAAEDDVMGPLSGTVGPGAFVGGMAGPMGGGPGAVQVRLGPASSSAAIAHGTSTPTRLVQVKFEVAQGVNLAIPSPHRKSRRTPSHEAIEMLAGKYKVHQMPPPYQCGPPLEPMSYSPSRQPYTLQERPSEEGDGAAGSEPATELTASATTKQQPTAIALLSHAGSPASVAADGASMPCDRTTGKVAAPPTEIPGPGPASTAYSSGPATSSHSSLITRMLARAAGQPPPPPPPPQQQQPAETAGAPASSIAASTGPSPRGGSPGRSSSAGSGASQGQTSALLTTVTPERQQQACSSSGASRLARFISGGSGGLHTSSGSGMTPEGAATTGAGTAAQQQLTQPRAASAGSGGAGGPGAGSGLPYPAVAKVTDGRQERESLEERRRREAIAVYGERWATKVKRIQRDSPHGTRPGWALRCVIVKSGDDCRQELLALQMVKLFWEIFHEAGLPLWVRHYEVLVTSNKTALIEMVPNTLSIHTIKSRSPPGTSLSDHFFAKFGRSGTPACTAAQRRFTESLAAYSLLCYVLQIKDRHNGNILMDDDGRIVHIDFGFLLSNSPGGVNFESAPFKLTRELLEVMDSNSDGRPSEMFDYFKVLMIQGFLALRKHAERVLLPIRMMSKSGFPCYKAGERAVKAVEKRLQLSLTEVQCVAHVLQLIAESLDAWRTRQYDYYQRVLNGIL